VCFGPQAAEAIPWTHHANETANRTHRIMKKLILAALALAVLPKRQTWWNTSNHCEP